MCSAPNVYMFVYILIGTHMVPLIRTLERQNRLNGFEINYNVRTLIVAILLSFKYHSVTIAIVLLFKYHSIKGYIFNEFIDLLHFYSDQSPKLRRCQSKMFKWLR